jgi:hypothetical protein
LVLRNNWSQRLVKIFQDAFTKIVFLNNDDLDIIMSLSNIWLPINIKKYFWFGKVVFILIGIIYTYITQTYTDRHNFIIYSIPYQLVQTRLFDPSENLWWVNFCLNYKKAFLVIFSSYFNLSRWKKQKNSPIASNRHLQGFRDLFSCFHFLILILNY